MCVSILLRAEWLVGLQEGVMEGITGVVKGCSACISGRMGIGRRHNGRGRWGWESRGKGKRKLGMGPGGGAGGRVACGVWGVVVVGGELRWGLVGGKEKLGGGAALRRWQWEGGEGRGRGCTGGGGGNGWRVSCGTGELKGRGCTGGGVS